MAYWYHFAGDFWIAWPVAEWTVANIVDPRGFVDARFGTNHHMYDHCGWVVYGKYHVYHLVLDWK